MHEYTHVLSNKLDDIVKDIQAHSREGWRVVTFVVPNSNSHSWYFIALLERELQGDPHEP